MHTKGKLNYYNMGATVQLCIGDVVVANVPAVDGVNHFDNTKRLAITWNSHDALVEAVKQMLVCIGGDKRFYAEQAFAENVLKQVKG